MIVPMKKAVIVVQQKDAKAALETLRCLGVLHIEHQQPPTGKDINTILEDLALINNALGILLEAKSNSAQNPVKKLSDWRFSARHIIDLHKRLEQLDDYSRSLLSTINQWINWGDFQPQEIEALAKKNIYIKLFQIPVKELKALPADVCVKIISTAAGFADCALVSQKKVELPYKEIALPKMGLSQMQARLSEDRRVMESIKTELASLSAYQQEFTAIKKRLENELEFYQALNGMGKTGVLSYLSGYLPFDALEQLASTAKKEKWALATDEPSESDNVPTLIRNPRWISLVSPIFKVLEIIPGYHELDISLWFLIFLSVFFGMLIGDAGYGTIYLALTFIAQRKYGGKISDKSIFALFYLLSAAAILWGILSGTFLGQVWLPPFVKPLIPALRSDRQMQAFCFFLGALHLSIAHAWRAVLKAPSPAALGDIGWMSIVWGMLYLARTLVLGDVFPPFGKWFFIVGVILVVLFTSPSRNIARAFGRGLGALVLSFVNSFTDIVSYIRLFAVGLATVAIADAFNAMAVSVGFNSVIAAALSSIILVMGHALNVCLGPLGMLVHGVRLNVLEFCNHVDVKWEGVAYKPLRESQTG